MAASPVWSVSVIGREDHGEGGLIKNNQETGYNNHMKLIFC
jgi:hypothetical protein